MLDKRPMHRTSIMNFRPPSCLFVGITTDGAAIPGERHRTRSGIAVGGETDPREPGKKKVRIIREEVDATNQKPLILFVLY
jgi:hypothetical protein